MSNALYRDLKHLVNMVEKQYINDEYRLKFHLMPTVGWLNDPNGLCKYGEYYHVFYQYGPFDATGGVKHWGHYRSKDLISWEKLPCMLYPDNPFDMHGVYSGSAFVDGETMYLYYTGNVKLDGDYDYISAGREHNTVLAISRDGITCEKKQLLMKNSDYPENLTCHVRDPKVFKYEGVYYMVQGARTKDNRGVLLVFQSNDMVKWSHKNTITTNEAFGYMWECPDLFCLDGQWFLICSPQGITKQGNHYQNIYTCGYFPLYGDFRGEYTLGEFKELDFGFDFYAPQTFEDENRRLMLGWAGMPDADYGNSQTVKNGWQHCMTSMCELKRVGNEIYRYPVKEIEKLRGDSIEACDATVFDMEYETDKPFEIILRDALKISYDLSVLTITHLNGGDGRQFRNMDINNIQPLRILADTSIVEIFVNNGQNVLTTRYYPNTKGIKINGHGTAKIWDMNGFAMRKVDNI